MTGTREILSDDVKRQIEKLAREENREAADVFEEASEGMADFMAVARGRDTP
jgi:predicted transcriptional regulator